MWYPSYFSISFERINFHIMTDFDTKSWIEYIFNLFYFFFRPRLMMSLSSRMIGEYNQWKICFDIFTDTMGGQFEGKDRDEPNSIIYQGQSGGLCNYNNSKLRSAELYINATQYPITLEWHLWGTIKMHSCAKKCGVVS